METPSKRAEGRVSSKQELDQELRGKNDARKSRGMGLLGRLDQRDARGMTG